MAHEKLSLAHEFVEYSATRLADIGFSVDQISTGGPYGASDVRFCTQDDLYLSVSFSPYDTGHAYTYFGRMWESDDGWRQISNYLHAFSNDMRPEFPEYHSLSESYEGLTETYESILCDLESVLPRVLRSVTASDLDKIEARQFGAIQSAKNRYGDVYIDKIHVKRSDN